MVKPYKTTQIESIGSYPKKIQNNDSKDDIKS